MKCRHCSTELKHVFCDLGYAPPSNSYIPAEHTFASEVWYPLQVLVCDQCWLVQTRDYAAREEFFSESYAYFSSTSQTWCAHARAFVTDMSSRFNLGEHSLICEVAANDGYLLQYALADGIPCYGVEPTSSTAAAARKKGIDIHEAFFGDSYAKQLVEHGKAADLTVANNVLAHVPDINDFVSGFATLLKPSGVATFEFPHLLNLIEKLQFDTIYHEHYSYLSLIAVERIFAANGLHVFDVQEWPTHGGSLRVFAQRIDSKHYEISEAVHKMVSRERDAKLDNIAGYKGFQKRTEGLKNSLLKFLLTAKEQGKRIAAYGAAAKGNTFINFAGIRSDLIPYVVDNAPAKQGQQMPGSHIPIFPADRIQSDRPDYVLILPWNLKEEISSSLTHIRSWGGQCVVAVPELEVF